MLGKNHRIHIINDMNTKLVTGAIKLAPDKQYTLKCAVRLIPLKHLEKYELALELQVELSLLNEDKDVSQPSKT